VERDIALFAADPPLHLHQFRQRLPETRDRLSDHRVHPALQPVLEYSRRKSPAKSASCAPYREGNSGNHRRPSLTYGDTQIALAINSWAKSYSFRAATLVIEMPYPTCRPRQTTYI